jgi:hypothetical protein
MEKKRIEFYLDLKFVDVNKMRQTIDGAPIFSRYTKLKSKMFQFVCFLSIKFLDCSKRPSK